MRVNYAELLFTLAYAFVFVAQINAYSTSNGKGVYKTYNAKKSLAALTTKKEPEKFLFNNMMMNDHSRAPLHDTPASPCKCSKYIHVYVVLSQMEILRRNDRF